MEKVQTLNLPIDCLLMRLQLVFHYIMSHFHTKHGINEKINGHPVHFQDILQILNRQFILILPSMTSVDALKYSFQFKMYVWLFKKMVSHRIAH